MKNSPYIPPERFICAETRQVEALRAINIPGSIIAPDVLGIIGIPHAELPADIQQRSPCLDPETIVYVTDQQLPRFNATTRSSYFFANARAAVFTDERVFLVDGEEKTALTPVDFNILGDLAMNAGCVRSPDQLLAAASGGIRDLFGIETVWRSVKNIRLALGDELKPALRNVRARGYVARLELPKS